MFKDRPNHPDIDRALADLNSKIFWNPGVINADVVILHNPAFLKMNASFKPRIVCDTLIVVTHENFTGPDGTLNFDVDACLTLIEEATLARTRILAPVSEVNRAALAAWHPEEPHGWVTSDICWTNICEFDTAPPRLAPADRRGRHSRPGFEKFPRRDVMELLFPEHAEYNGILGGDIFVEDDPPSHWAIYNFRDIPVSHFLEGIDFFVYFTNPRWHESFGRVIGEAIAAGKLVLTDPATARTFGRGVIGLAPEEVDACIARHIADPAAYAAQVRQAQRGLGTFNAQRFRERAAMIMETAGDSR